MRLMAARAACCGSERRKTDISRLAAAGWVAGAGRPREYRHWGRSRRAHADGCGCTCWARAARPVWKHEGMPGHMAGTAACGGCGVTLPLPYASGGGASASWCVRLSRMTSHSQEGPSAPAAALGAACAAEIELPPGLHPGWLRFAIQIMSSSTVVQGTSPSPRANHVLHRCRHARPTGRPSIWCGWHPRQVGSRPTGYS